METQVDQISSPNWDNCARDCLACFEACMRCLSHCLEYGGKHANKSHLNLLLECQSICHLTANVLYMRSEEARYFCELCAKICDACADACKEIGDTSELQGCAYHCKGCADSCRSFINNAG